MRGADRRGDRGNGVVQRGCEESVERPRPLPDDYALTRIHHLTEPSAEVVYGAKARS